MCFIHFKMEAIHDGGGRTNQLAGSVFTFIYFTLLSMLMRKKQQESVPLQSFVLFYFFVVVLEEHFSERKLKRCSFGEGSREPPTPGTLLSSIVTSGRSFPTRQEQCVSEHNSYPGSCALQWCQIALLLVFSPFGYRLMGPGKAEQQNKGHNLRTTLKWMQLMN